MIKQLLIGWFVFCALVVIARVAYCYLRGDFSNKPPAVADQTAPAPYPLVSPVEIAAAKYVDAREYQLYCWKKILQSESLEASYRTEEASKALIEAVRAARGNL